MRGVVWVMMLLGFLGVLPALTSAETPGNRLVFDSDLVTLHQQMPSLVTVDEPFEILLIVTGKREGRDITVVGELPDGATLIDAVPQAEATDNQVTWRIHSLQANQRRTFRMRVKAASVGDLESCVSLAVTGTACVSTQAGKPELLVRKKGPDSALLGEEVTFIITVENVGTSSAREVVIVDKIPSGFRHDSGNESVSWQIAELPPNRSHTFEVPLTAVKRGRFCNEAEVSTATIRSVTAKTCTDVLQPNLKISKSGPAKQILGRESRYMIKVENNGDTILRDLVVVDTLPEGTELVSAPGASVKDRAVTWNLAMLGPGDVTELSVLLTCSRHGEFCNRASVRASNGLTDQAELCTQWIGHAGLMLEVIDSSDPLQVGDETEYLIVVKNQGTAADTNILIKAVIPAELELVSFEGATEGKVDGVTVVFAPLPQLGAQDEVSWRLKAKGKTAGDARLRVEMSSQLLQTPVPEEESTYVY